MSAKPHVKRGKTAIDGNLLGPCGFYCGYCLAFKKGVCLGCRYQADRNASKGDLKWCSLLNCAEKHGVEMCSECRAFPCKREYDPRRGMYGRVYYEYLRDDIKPR